MSSVSKGHVYNVTAEVILNGKKYPAETNFVYIGETANQASVETNWDSLGGTVDLTAHSHGMKRSKKPRRYSERIPP